MASAAAAPQSQIRDKALAAALAARSTKVGASSKSDDSVEIKSNPAYQIIYSEEISTADKPKALSAFFTQAKTETEQREVMKAFQQAMEYTAEKRQELALAMVRLQQSDTQVELQNTIKFLNDGMLNFETLLKPCTEVIDAIYKLSLQDKAYTAYKEIKQDEEAKKIYDLKKNDITEQVNHTVSEIERLQNEIIACDQDKNFFGQIKSASAAKKATNLASIAKLNEDLLKAQEDLKNLGNPTQMQSELDPDLLESKAAIAKFLNLSNSEVKEQQEQLFKAAEDFIKVNRERIGNMRKLLSTDETSILKMVDASEMLGMIYSNVSDGCNLASDALKKRRESLLPKEGEVLTETEKKLRASELRRLDSYIENFEKNKTSTQQTSGKVTELQNKFDNLKKGNEEGSELTRVLHTDAIAEVSEGLVTTLTSLSTSAIGQSAEIAKSNLRRMNALTTEIAQKDSIRNAMGEERRVIEAQETIASLKSWTDVMATKSNIVRDTFGRLKDSLTELSQVTQEAKAARDDVASAAADVFGEGDEDKAGPAKKSSSPLENL